MKIYSFNGFTPYLDERNGEQHIDGFVLEYTDKRKYYFRTALIQIEKVGTDYILVPLEGGVFPSSRADRFVINLTDFNITEQQLIEIIEPSGGFSGDITQHSIKNFITETQADATTRTNYVEGERIRISDLDEVFEVVKLDAPTPGNASSTPLQVGSDLYFLSFDAGTYGQLLKQDSSGSTVVVHQFEANANGNGNGNKPLGTLITDGTYIYIETTSGGAGNLGTLIKYDTLSGAVLKLLDFNNTIGNTSNINYTAASTKDKAINGTNLYLSTSQGGSNGLGTILKVNIVNGSSLVLFNHDTQGNPVLNSNNGKGFGAIVGGFYYTFVKNKMYKVNLTTDVVTTTTTPLNTSGLGTEPNTGFVVGSDIYLFSDIRATPLKIETANADNFTISSFSYNVGTGTNVAFKDGVYTYHNNLSNGNIVRWEIGTNNIDFNNTDHSLLVSGIAYNGTFDAVSGVLYYTTGGSTTSTQTQVYKYDVNTKTNTLLYDLSNPIAVQTNTTTLLSIPQSSTEGLYLRVRDNHIKSVSLSGRTVTTTTTRGTEADFDIPSLTGYDVYNTAAFTGGSPDITVLTGGAAFVDVSVLNSAPAITSSEYLPTGITQLYDFANQRIDIGNSGVDFNDVLTVDLNYNFNQDVDDSILQIQLLFTEDNGTQFTKGIEVAFVGSGAGVDIAQQSRITFFAGEFLSQSGTVQIQVACNEDADFKLNNLTIYINS